MPGSTPNALLRLRKHADYQRVYKASRKQWTRQMAFFYALRPELGPDGRPTRSATAGPRIGLTVGKVLGKAHERNRIKRRLRELIRRHARLLAAWPVDVILHPRRNALTLPHAELEREVRQALEGVRRALAKPGTERPQSGAQSSPQPGAVAATPTDPRA